MKYKLQFLLFSILGFSCLKNADYVIINDWQSQQLKGEVSSITEVKFNAFDSLGTIVSAEQNETTFFSFNSEGYEIEEWEKVNGVDSLNTYDYWLKYDYQYDEKGYITEKNAKDNNGSVLNKFKFNFDISQNQQKINIYDSNGLLQFVKTVRFNNKGKPLEINSINSQGKLFVNMLNIYDERGNNIRSTIKNNISESNDNFRVVNVFRKFDNFGNLKEEKEKTERDEQSFTYEYKFDSKGNWTEKVVFLNQLPKLLIKREIKYFH